MDNLYYVIGASIIAMIYAFWKTSWINSQDVLQKGQNLLYFDCSTNNTVTSSSGGNGLTDRFDNDKGLLLKSGQIIKPKIK